MSYPTPAKIIHFLIKFLNRSADLTRGGVLYLNIILCGGTCNGWPRVGRGVVFRYPPHEGFVFGRNLYIGPYCIIEAPLGAKINIGDRTRLTSGVLISASVEVSIGADCLIAEWASIRDSQHRFVADKHINMQELESEAISIGDDVWIGRSAAVFRGAIIECGCIIGSGAQIRRKTLHRNGIYVGEPLKLLGYRQP